MMAKHGGGNGGTMKDDGDWKGNKGAKTEPIRTPPKEPIKDDIITKDDKR